VVAATNHPPSTSLPTAAKRSAKNVPLRRGSLKRARSPPRLPLGQGHRQLVHGECFIFPEIALGSWPPRMPNKDQQEGLERNLELLAKFGRLKKKRSSACNVHDSQVARSASDWREALIKPLPPPPSDRFVRQLRYTENGMHFTLRVNDEFIVIDADAPFGGNILCSFGCKPRLHASFTRSDTLSTTFGVPVFLESGSMSQDAPPLLGRLSILECLRELRLTGLESLHIRNGQAALYLQ
jgi:hypothetical protein